MSRPKGKGRIPRLPHAISSERGAPFIEAPGLFSIATWATRRLLASREGERIEAPIAIVFAALFLEAFINEVGVLAGTVGAMWDDNPKEVFQWAVYWREAEEDHASVEEKFDLLHYAFRRKRFDRGRSPFQDFALLVDLRNEFVHLKAKDRILSWTAGKIEVQANPMVRKLVSRKIVDSKEVGAPTSWIVLVSTREAAVWACNTAAGMVKFLIDLVPDSPFRRNLVTLYGACTRWRPQVRDAIP